MHERGGVPQLDIYPKLHIFHAHNILHVLFGQSFCSLEASGVTPV